MSPIEDTSARRPDDLPPRRRGLAADEELQRRRAASAGLGAQPLEPTVAITQTTIGGVAAVVCSPPAPQGVIVHLHGGGYRMGSATAWTPFGARLAKACGLQVILPEYALAPESPFPCALHDALAVLQAAAGAAGPLLVGGDSAGGGLALAAALAAAAQQRPVAGAVLISPWLDLTNSASSFQSCAATDQLFSKQSADAAAAAYLQGWQAADPLASPLFAALALAPPVLVLASTHEVLLQDSLSLARGLAAAGRPVRLHLADGQPHVWPVLSPDAPASHEALAAMADFVGAIRRR